MVQGKMPARAALGVAAFGLLAAVASPADGGVVFGLTGSTLAGGARWDAAPRSITGNERSLQGGLRFSVQGGSYQAYRDLFTWNSVPSVPQFQQAVEQAFAAWTFPDPTTGLTTSITFTPDFGTTPQGVVGGGSNINGAEIDLFGVTDAQFWNPGSNGTQGETWFNTVNGAVTLTSGTPNYAGTSAIAGSDIYINNNPGAVYSLDLFRRLLTHELGHALGLGDVEGTISPGRFIDDNYNGANAATIQATMTNSWAALINPLDPAATPGLALYTIGSASTTSGVDILMESNGLGIAVGNPVTNPTPLTNDDYATRQFLYPSLIPEPSSAAQVAALAVPMLGRRRRRRS